MRCEALKYHEYINNITWIFYKTMEFSPISLWHKCKLDVVVYFYK